MTTRRIVITGSFDNLRSRDARLLQEASAQGPVHVLLWSDIMIRTLDGSAPHFPQAERLYFLQAIRYVHRVTVITGPDQHAIPDIDRLKPDVWVVGQGTDHPQKRAFCDAAGLAYHVVPDDRLHGFPIPPPEQPLNPARKTVIATGSFDWLHSGHVRFFEEASALGNLIVAVGHDANLRLLKGEGHPLFAQDERRYMVHAIRFVAQTVITSGHGWLDAEPEIYRLQPDIYIVNEDGDKPEKQAFCKAHGIEYVVLKRAPKDGLPPRSSTTLRGF